jgi:hypothetical protein
MPRHRMHLSLLPTSSRHIPAHFLALQPIFSAPFFLLIMVEGSRQRDDHPDTLRLPSTVAGNYCTRAELLFAWSGATVRVSQWYRFPS